MFQIIWEFTPAAGRERDFEAAYGADGPWIALFRKSDGYLGTDFEPRADRPGRYRTTDRWTSQAAYDAFRATHRAEYEAIDRACAALTADERHIPPATAIAPPSAH